MRTTRWEQALWLASDFMNLRYEASPPKTIDQVCGKPAGTFAKFLRVSECLDAMREARAQRRIREAHEKRKANNSGQTAGPKPITDSVTNK